MKIDPSSHVPIYLQIADGIREAVAAGIYLPDEPLPSLRTLALDAQVNPNTVQRAYEELARDGIIYARRGMGMYVAERAKVDARSGAVEAVRRCFDEGIRAGFAAGMTAGEIRNLFRSSMSARASKKE